MPQSRRDLAPMRGTVDTTGSGGSNDAALRASARYFDEDVPRVSAVDHDYDDGSGRAYEQTHASLTAEQRDLLAQTSGKDEGQLARFTGSRRGDPEMATSDDSDDYGAIGTFGGAVRRGAAEERRAEARRGDEESVEGEDPTGAEAEPPQASTTEERRASVTGEFREATTEGHGVPESPTGVQGTLEGPEQSDETAAGYPHLVAGIDGPRDDQPGGERESVAPEETTEGEEPAETAQRQADEEQEQETTEQQRADEQRQADEERQAEVQRQAEQSDQTASSEQEQVATPSEVTAETQSDEASREGAEDASGAEQVHDLPEGTLSTVKSAKDYVEAGEDDAERKARAQAVRDAEPPDEQGGRSTLIDFLNDVLSEDE